LKIRNWNYIIKNGNKKIVLENIEEMNYERDDIFPKDDKFQNDVSSDSIDSEVYE